MTSEPSPPTLASQQEKTCDECHQFYLEEESTHDISSLRHSMPALGQSYPLKSFYNPLTHLF